MQRRSFGLIGFPLEHSFSKKYFQEKFEKEFISDAAYELFPIRDISELKNLILKNPDLQGLNITIPYKEAILPYLDSLDDTAKEIGAVNVLKITRKNNDVILSGYNTDILGFEACLGTKIADSALVLGTGGAAKAVFFALKKRGIKVQLVSRRKNNDLLSYEELTESVIRKHLLIINCTPLGMFPNENDCPLLPYQAIGKEHLLIDLIYNPEKTLFLKKGEQQGASIMNGSKMFYTQAQKAWEIWNVESS